MGSYSMKCDASGLEIAEGDVCYVALIKRDAYREGYKLYTPPIKGTYADSGELRIMDPESFTTFWGINTEDQFRLWNPLDEGENEYAFWLSETAFNAFPLLERDYSHYGGPHGTVSDDCRGSMANMLTVIEKADKKLRMFDSIIAEFLQQGLPEKAEMFTSAYDYEIDAITKDIFIDRNELLPNLVKKNLPLDEYLLGYERSFNVAAGMLELRKSIVPQEFCRGPQHGGERALTLFYELVLHDLHERMNEIKEENEDDDE